MWELFGFGRSHEKCLALVDHVINTIYVDDLKRLNHKITHPILISILILLLIVVEKEFIVRTFKCVRKQPFCIYIFNVDLVDLNYVSLSVNLYV